MADGGKQCWLMKGCPSRTGVCYSCVPDGDECPVWRWFKKQILLKEQEQTHGGWISVKDRLPEESGTVLACDRLGAFYMCEYSQKYKAFNADDNDGDMYSLSAITHWMPMPPPPKEG